MNVLRSLPLVLLTLLSAGITPLPAAEIYIGSGVKAGEVTDSSAIVVVRLTTRPDQDADGLIPGAEGEARLVYGVDPSLAKSASTDWEPSRPDADWSIHFPLKGLEPGKRQFYRVEYRAGDKAAAKQSEVFSFVTAPKADVRAPVYWHMTTCQDLEGFGTYKHMTALKPDFVISDGDNVYYDGQCLSRNVPQAWQAYQKMFGLPDMKEYYKNVGGYFMKDDHDFRFNDCDPYMPGVWRGANRVEPGAKYTETKGNQRLDVAWMTAAEGAQVFRTVFPMSEKPYRTFRWGKGLQLWLLENREYRSPNAMEDGPDKTIWGAEQKAWLKKSLLESDADYRIIVSPNPIIGPDRILKGDNQANSNGYWHEGQEFLNWLRDNHIDNVVTMTGDRHWQYHSIDKREGRHINEFSCGPTYDEHVQAVPPPYDGVDRPYSASRGGFLAITYQPDQSLSFEHYSSQGEKLYRVDFSGGKTTTN